MFLLIFILFETTNGHRYFSHRIVGGDRVQIQQFPYQAALELEGFPFCGGSILTTNKVLTAAHCTENLQAKQISVRVGSSYSGEGGKEVAVKKIHSHPLYSNCTQNNDVSVLTLASHLEFGPLVAPIRLEPPRMCIMYGRTGVVTGWGLLSHNGRSARHLHAVTIYEINNEDCEFLYRPTGKIITRQMSCFGYPGGGKDACQGDSGGPLVSNGIQIGIVSWGLGCADETYPGVFARISELRDHIDKYAYRVFDEF